MRNLDTILQWAINKGKAVSAIIAWLDLFNVNIWYSADNYQSGRNLTIPTLSKYLIAKVKIYSIEQPVLMVRQRADYYYGGAALGYDSYQYTAAVSLTKNSDGTWKLMCYEINHVSGSSHGALITTYGVNEIVGLVPLWGGVL